MKNEESSYKWKTYTYKQIGDPTQLYIYILLTTRTNLVSNVVQNHYSIDNSNQWNEKMEQIKSTNK